MTYVATEAGVDVVHVPGLKAEPGLWDDLKALWWLYRYFRSERPEIVHTHTAKAGAVGRLAAVLARVPIRVHTYHGHVLGGHYFSASRTALYRFAERVLARLTQRLVVLSAAQQRELSEVLHVAPARRFARIPLGLDLARFVAVDRPQARAAARARMEIPTKAWVVGTVGRVVPVKNHELLIRAFAGALLREPGLVRRARLLLVGDGSAERRASLNRLAHALGISDELVWLGWRRDLPELLSAMDVFALTSHDEGTPVALLEAASAGTPIVARAVGGVPDILAELPGATLVGSDRPEGFTTALLESRNLDPTPTASHAVRSAFAEHFSQARLNADMQTLYEELVAETATTGRA